MCVYVGGGGTQNESEHTCWRACAGRGVFMCESIWEWKVVIHSAVGVMSHVQYVVSVHLVWCLQSVVRA